MTEAFFVRYVGKDSHPKGGFRGHIMNATTRNEADLVGLARGLGIDLQDGNWNREYTDRQGNVVADYVPPVNWGSSS